MENEKQYLIDFATKLEMSDNRISCLMRTIEDARAICLFDQGNETFINTTDKKADGEIAILQNPIAGLSMYLISLEMIGKVFNKKPHPKDSQKTGVKRAIEQFSNISKEEKHAISALRSALLHTTSLVNIPKNEKSFGFERHKFSLDFNSQNGSIVEFPKAKWDGKFTSRTNGPTTKIRVLPLIKSIEAVYARLVDDLSSDSIELNLEWGMDELSAKYTM